MLRMWGNMSDLIFYCVEYMCAALFVRIGIISGEWDLGEFLIVLIILWATTMILFCIRKSLK